MDGEGNFNWRFVFPFAFIPAEKKLVIKEKVHILLPVGEGGNPISNGRGMLVTNFVPRPCFVGSV